MAVSVRADRRARVLPRRITWRDSGVIVCICIIAGFTLAAIFAPLLAPHNPTLVNLSVPDHGSSAQYLLGTDSEGRDLLSR